MASESEIVSQQQKRSQSSDNVLVTPPTTPPIVVPYAERCERRRRNLRRDRAKAYRDLTSLRVQLTCQKRATMRYKKRLQRLKETSDSPTKTSTAHLVKGTRPGQAGAEVRRVLSFHSALIKQDNREHITKQIIRTLASGNVLKRYRMLDRARRVFAGYGVSLRSAIYPAYPWQRRLDALSATVLEKTKAFYEQDDNSRMLPGKRDTITKKQMKKRNRLLYESMAVLHDRYMYDHPASPVAYSTVCRRKPFWVVPPKMSDRDSNVQSMTDTLLREGAIESVRPVEQYTKLVCDVNRTTCMYGECTHCEDKDVWTSWRRLMIR